jgi:hypothetical protein
MEPLASVSSKKYLIIGAGVVLVLLLVVFMVMSGARSRKQSAVPTLTPTPEPRYVPSYVPPPNIKYSTLDSLNFLPKTINGIVLDQKKLQDDVRRIHPDYNNNDIVDAVNATVFTWLALNEFYATHDQSKVSDFYKKDIVDFALIDKERKDLEAVYRPNEIKMSGLYLKIRFSGVIPNNIKRLKKSEDQLPSLASQLIQKYKTDLQNATDKEALLTTFNKDQTVLLLNNREISKSFKDSSLFPPLVADTNYYDMMQSLSIGRVSDVHTLTTRLYGKTDPEEYAYAVFYISSKSGSYLPLEILVNDYIATATIE